jgi:hypothetical protein
VRLYSRTLFGDGGPRRASSSTTGGEEGIDRCQHARGEGTSSGQSDAQAIAAVHVSAWREAYRGLIPGGTIDVGGHELERTKRFRDVARTRRAAIVIDDLASTDPWRPRAIEVRGRAEAIEGPRALIRIHPQRIVSWGLGPGRSARDVASASAPVRAA